MGHLAAAEMATTSAELAPGAQRAALTWHLRSNHYPPLPHEYVGLLETALEYRRSGDGEAIVYLPATLPMWPRAAEPGGDGTYHITAAGLVDALRAWEFVDPDGE